MLKHAFAIVAVLVSAAVSYAQAPAAAGPAKLLEKQPYVLSPAQIQEYPEQTFFYVTSDATQKTMPDVMRKLMPHLTSAAKAAGIEVPSGAVLIVFSSLTPDPDAQFQVEAGIVVPEATKAAGDAQVRGLEPFRCATVLYTGSMENIGKAYESLFQGIAVSGVVPTMNVRQMMLYWEDEKSPNNIMLVQVGLQ